MQIFFIQLNFSYQKRQYLDQYNNNKNSQQSFYIMTFKQFIKEMDFFSHSQFIRYKNKENYRTFTGGLISIFIIIIFVGIFFNIMIQTFEKKIIIGSQSRKYHLDPTYFQASSNQNGKFLFAIGLKSLNLSSKKQYFTIKVDHLSFTGGGSTRIRNQTSIKMIPCTLSMWEGINDQIKTSFENMNPQTWLCPEKDFKFTFEGKFTSQKFKYFRIFVEKCVASDTIECATQAQFNKYMVDNEGGTVYTYFINTIINPSLPNYIQYYVQDSNYFTFNQVTGVTSNIFFSQYQIQTDNSLLPTNDFSYDRGILLKNTAYGQPITITSNRYAKIYIRKSDSNIQIVRSFQKYHQTLSFMGGLYSTAILFLFVIGVYDKYSYQIQFGDRFFKRDNNSSYGSQSFNLLSFFGYSIFNFCKKLGWQLNWESMKIFNQCRRQCIKQLDFHLLMKKIQHFQQVSWLVLEEHHLRGLYLLPRRPIKDVKKNRKRYLMQNIIYHQLQRKGRLINIEKEMYQNKCQQFMETRENRVKELDQNQNNDIDLLYTQFAQSYQEIMERSKAGDDYSKRILEKIQFTDIWKTLFEIKKMKLGANIERKPSIINNLESQQKIYPIDNDQQLIININPLKKSKSKVQKQKQKSNSVSSSQPSNQVKISEIILSIKQQSQPDAIQGNINSSQNLRKIQI